DDGRDGTDPGRLVRRRPARPTMVRPLNDLNTPPARRRGRRRRDDVFAPPRPPTLDFTPRGLRPDRPSRHQRFRPRRQLDLTILFVAGGALVLVAWLGWSFWNATRVRVEMSGLESGAQLQPDAAADLAIAITIPNGDDRYRASLTLDGVELTRALDWDDETMVVAPADLVAADVVEGALDEGEHRLRLSVGRLFL